MRRKESIEDVRNKCSECYDAKFDFEVCKNHKISHLDVSDCNDCAAVRNLVKSFQQHRHTFTCKKKCKNVSLKSTEGHGKYDGVRKGEPISNYSGCRFNFPQFPMNRTTLIMGFSKDLSSDEKAQRKSDLKKIKKYLIRQSYDQESEAYSNFKKLTFLEFLHNAGMFEEKSSNYYTDAEKVNAYERYINALSASVKGTGQIFLERSTEDLFTNNFNLQLLKLHQANIDIQIVIDQVC